MASKLVFIIVNIMYGLAFGLALAAERHRITAKVVQDNAMQYNYCVYDSDIATGYSIAALLLLTTAQIIIMVVSKCLCCGKPLTPGLSRACAILLFIISWIFFIIAEIILLSGSVRNAYHTRKVFTDTPPDCEMLRRGIFIAGAMFVLFTSIVTQSYYLCCSKATENFQQPHETQTGVSMETYK